jgi:predicted ATP-grasp superfamily ATP-dependent carboligase
MVIDRFGDADTYAAAATVEVVAAHADGTLNAGEVAAGVARARCQAPRTPVVWGGGLEAQPELLALLAQDGPLLGSDLAALRWLRTPELLARELATLEVPMPAVARTAQAEHGWLRKRCAAAGGWHVQSYTPESPLLTDEYVQRAVPGRSYSYTFLATGESIRELGFNQLLNLQPSVAMPFRYGGAVGGAQLPATVQIACAEIAQRIARHFGWRGLCGFDLVYDGCNLTVVDLNPRPTATFGLAHSASNAFTAHLAACREQPLPALFALPAIHGHLVCYAVDAIQIPKSLNWPNWVADRPRADSLIPAGAPLCSIQAASGKLTDTIALLTARLAILSQRFEIPTEQP